MYVYKAIRGLRDLILGTQPSSAQIYYIRWALSGIDKLYRGFVFIYALIDKLYSRYGDPITESSKVKI
jgi:hypothetical protein